MKLLGMELSDAGILVAGGQPAGLLEIDQSARTSPGYALLQKKKVLIGRAAESIAHLQPRKIQNHFWDQLGTEPLEHPAKQAQNQAELAFLHLTQIWEQIGQNGDCAVMAVPDHYSRTQLGLLQGMAQELDLRVLGYLPLSIASAAQPEPGEFLFYLDIHLHRMELTCLRQAERLHLVDSMTLPGKGLLYWQKQWVEAIASEFVHTTRFDPLHRAETEQALYDRLPKITADLKIGPTAGIEMPAGPTTYRTTISVEQLLKQNADGLKELDRALGQISRQQGLAVDAPVNLLVSGRIASLPGVMNHLSARANVRVIELAEGAGAHGAIALWESSSPSKNGPAAVFRTSKPWTPGEVVAPDNGAETRAIEHPPTHILHDSVAYPIGDRPLYIDSDFDSGHHDIHIHYDPFKAGDCHLSIRRSAAQFFIEASEKTKTTVNGQAVVGSAKLARGDIIGLGAKADIHLKLIACLLNDET